MRVNAAPLLDASGHLTGVVASARDITELKLAVANSAQQEKFAAMGQMLAGAAHELNNPLTAILGVSDLLRESAADQLSRRQANLVFQQGAPRRWLSSRTFWHFPGHRRRAGPK